MGVPGVLGMVNLLSGSSGVVLRVKEKIVSPPSCEDSVDVRSEVPASVMDAADCGEGAHGRQWKWTEEAVKADGQGHRLWVCLLVVMLARGRGGHHWCHEQETFLSRPYFEVFATSNRDTPCPG